MCQQWDSNPRPHTRTRIPREPIALQRKLTLESGALDHSAMLTVRTVDYVQSYSMKSCWTNPQKLEPERFSSSLHVHLLLLQRKQQMAHGIENGQDKNRKGTQSQVKTSLHFIFIYSDFYFHLLSGFNNSLEIIN